MELDTLKAAWHTLDDRLASAQAVSVSMSGELKRSRARSALRPLGWYLGLELVIAAGAALWIGGFLADHWRVARFAGAALALHVAALLTIASAVSQLWMLMTIDYAGPVIDMQNTLTDLAVRRARDVRWQWLLMLPLWTPAAIVVMEGVFGVDLYRWFGTGWVLANVAFSVALTPMMIWVVRRFDRRIRQDGILKALANDVTGRRLSEAIRHLDAITEFQRESGGARRN